MKVELRLDLKGAWWHRVAGEHDSRIAGDAAAWWGPYRTKGIAKGAMRRRFRNREASDFEWVEVSANAKI